MENWDETRYEEKKRRFIRARATRRLWWQLTLLFAITWGAAWACSAALLALFGSAHDWARLLPLRYAIAFLFAYACFFLAVRVWIVFAREAPWRTSTQDGSYDWGDSTDLSGIGDFGNVGDLGDLDEGCLLVLVVLLISLVASGVVLAIGGAPLLLEVAFEAAFAGVVVTRPLRGNLVIGDWKGRLLANTWKPALGAWIALISLAAFLHSRAPHAATFAQAVSALLHSHAH